ncbi:MAG TPA: 30S ribosome-binding factor RbfA [Gammaproteobacteria bacterium]|jgi:ribosome-binding factor A
MPREFSRRLRVGAELERFLNELLQFEVKDPRLQDVRVTEVEVSGDLGVARVFYSLLDPNADPEPARLALERASAFMRSRVGKAVRLRRVPELRFEVDSSAREGLRISQLIDETRAGDSDQEPVDS